MNGRGFLVPSAPLEVGILYPGPEPEGFACLAVHALLEQVRRSGLASVEPVFLPARGLPVRTAWTGRALGELDALLATLSFEQHWAGLPALLARGGLPARAGDRADHHPLVVAGGMAVRLNPRPGLPFLDAIAPGDSEPVLPGLLERLAAGRDRPRAERLQELSGLPGVLTAPWVGQVRAILGRAVQPVCQVVRPEVSHFAGMHLVETGRGCPAGCRFCALSFTSRPPTFFAPDALREAALARIEPNDTIGLVGASLGRHPALLELVDGLRAEGAHVSPASLDPEAVFGPEGEALLGSLLRAGQRQATLAFEAGSERLRRVINKPFEEGALVEAAVRLAEAGVVHLKLYAMFGLPTEEAEDREALVQLVARVRAAWLQGHRGRGGAGRLSVSLNPFVPKPHTPFEREPMPPLAALRRDRGELVRAFSRLGGIDVSGLSPREAALQCLVDRGSEELADLLEASDGRWPPPNDVLRACAPDAACVHRAPDAPFPWRIVDVGVEPAFLERERERAFAARTTPACEAARCPGCRGCAGIAE